MRGDNFHDLAIRTSNYFVSIMVAKRVILSCGCLLCQKLNKIILRPVDYPAFKEANICLTVLLKAGEISHPHPSLSVSRCARLY